MSTLHPPQDAVPVVVFTPAGWIRGTFHVPKVKTLLGFLNLQEEILKLTEVILPGTSQAQPFLALHKSAALLVIPQRSNDPSMPGRDRRLVTCLLSMGSVRGYLDVAETVRTSDFFLRSPSFIELQTCHVGPNPYLDPAETAGEPFPLVLVNARSLVGATEYITAGE